MYSFVLCDFIITRYKPKFWNYGTLPVLHTASAQNNSMELIQSKNLKIVYLLTLRMLKSVSAVICRIHIYPNNCSITIVVLIAMVSFTTTISPDIFFSNGRRNF